jgi:hypothetical protein
MFYAFSYIEYKDTDKIRNNKQNLVENNYTVPKISRFLLFFIAFTYTVRAVPGCH